LSLTISYILVTYAEKERERKKREFQSDEHGMS